MDTKDSCRENICFYNSDFDSVFLAKLTNISFD